MTVGDHRAADVRVSDADRERAVSELRDHLEAGRLTFDEFTERVGEAYAARTAADLDTALRELPRATVAEPQRRRAPRRTRLRPAVGRFVSINGICIGVWAMSGGHYFWPAWVLLPTGMVTLRRLIAGAPAYDGEVPEQAGARTSGAAPYPRDVSRVVTTVLFVDIVGSTERAAALGDAAWRRLLDDYERRVSHEIEHGDGEWLFTKGDEIVAAFASPAAGLRCVRAIRAQARALGLEVRAGLHAGEVDRRGREVSGIAMHIGQRVCDRAAPGQVLVSSTVRDLLVGSGFTFAGAGEHELKGLPGTWRLYAVHDRS